MQRLRLSTRASRGTPVLLSNSPPNRSARARRPAISSVRCPAGPGSNSPRPQRRTGTEMETRPPLPPFTTISAAQKVRAAEDGWNSRDPARELEYRLIKELWAHDGNRIAVRFAHEWHDADGRWFRSYGNENWEFAANGLMQQRIASINDLPIEEGDGLFHWSQDRRPDDHPGLSDLGL